MEWHNQVNDRNEAIKEQLLQQQTRQFKPSQKRADLYESQEDQEENFYEEEEEAPQNVEAPNYYYDPETGDYFEYEGNDEDNQEEGDHLYVDENGALIEVSEDEDRDVIEELEEEQYYANSGMDLTGDSDQARGLSQIQKKYLEKYGVDPNQPGRYSYNINLENRTAIQLEPPRS